MTGKTNCSDKDEWLTSKPERENNRERNMNRLSLSKTLNVTNTVKHQFQAVDNIAIRCFDYYRTKKGLFLLFFLNIRGFNIKSPVLVFAGFVIFQE